MASLRIVLLAAALLSGVAATVATAHAQVVDRVAAVVNDEAITALELDMRLRLTLLSSRLPDKPDIRQRILPQTLRKLVDERLQLQEAARLKIAVSKEEIANAIAIIERQNRMPAGGLAKVLEATKIPLSTIEHQAKAELSWRKVVRQTMLSRVKVGDDEVKDRLEMLRANLGRPEYLAAEIVLTVDDSDTEADVRRLADRILDQLREGVPFQILARQFSQSASAASGGDLDWLPENSLSSDMATALASMQPGTVAGPLRTEEGYRILLLRDRRIAGQTPNTEGAVALAQAIVPIGDDRDAARKQAEEIAATVKSCADFDALAKTRGLPQSGRIGTIELADLADGLRTIIAGLDILQPSSPIEDANGFRVIMVCGRTGGATQSAGLPSADEIQNQLVQERLDLMARRYLRELRRSAFVEVRL